MNMNSTKVFAYRQLNTSGFARSARTLHFYELGSPDSASPLVILPEATTEAQSRLVLAVLGCDLVEWEELS